jgi:hypothetical protein
MEWILLIAGLLAVLLVVAVLLWRPVRAFGREVQVERARELFELQRERLAQEYLTAASASGKPRGLRWLACEFDGAMHLARDRHTGLIVAILPVTIQFEAIPGSDMEGLPAVANLRQASAVFFFDRGQWHTAGKTVFNLDPAEALEQYRHQYEPVREGS